LLPENGHVHKLGLIKNQCANKCRIS